MDKPLISMCYDLGTYYLKFLIHKAEAVRDKLVMIKFG